MDFEEASKLVIPHGRYKGKLGKIPSWYLKWLSQSWSDVTIREGARSVLDGRSRLGIPEKPKKQPKNPTIALIPEKRESKKVDYQVQNANLTGQDAF